MASETALNKKWARESDARTLAEAVVIKNTPARIKGARQAAKSLAKDAQKDATAMNNIAGGSGGGTMSKSEIKKEGIVVTKG